VAQVSTLVGKLNELESSFKTIGGARFDDVNNRMQRLNRGIHSQIDLLAQRWKNLKDLAGSLFESGVGGFMDWMGGKFLRAQAFVKQHETEIRAAIARFNSGFASAFKQAFAKIPAVNQELRRLVGLLSSPDPEKWGRFGTDLGKLAGVKFDTAIKGLKAMARILEGMGKAASAVVGYADRIAGFRDKYAPSRLNPFAPKTPRLPKGGRSVMDDDRMVRMANKLSAYNRGRSEPPMRAEPARRPTVPTSGVLDLVPGARDAIARAGAGPAAVAQPPQVNVAPPEVTANVRVRIGDREIRDIVAEVRREHADSHGVGWAQGFAQ
jgi:hypothetical protein